MDEMTANDEDYILQEYLRVQGFDIYGATSFVVKDFNRPTTNELNEYLKLTPAQKVAWLQANLNTSKRETFKGIFKYINVNINNRKSNKGNYQQAILKINDQIDDINVLIQEFENSYYNSNPFVQLAAIDLIKYAFLVEGFTFKRGNISKIISNTPLCESHINKGTNIISELTSALDSFHDVNELIDCYFRSHSDLIKKLFLDIYFIAFVISNFPPIASSIFKIIIITKITINSVKLKYFLCINVSSICFFIFINFLTNINI